MEPSKEIKIERILAAKEFLKIIDGHNDDFIYHSSNDAENVRMSQRAAAASGKPFQLRPVRIPSPWLAHGPALKYEHLSPEDRPTWAKPHYTGIKGNVIYTPYRHDPLTNTSRQMGELERELIFSSCRFSGKLDLTNLKSTKKIHFENFYLNEDDSLGFEEVDLRFFNCSIPELYLTNILSKTTLLENCTVTTLEINCERNIINKLIIKNCNITTLKITKNVKFIEITNIEKLNKLDITANYEKLNINTESFIINEQDPKDNSKILNKIIIPFNEPNYNINSLFIENNDKQKSETTIQSTNYNDVCLTGINSGNTIINMVTMKTLTFDNFTNTGHIKVVGLQKIDTLKIRESILGKLELLSINLEKSKISFSNSSIHDIILNGSRFPNNISGITNTDYKNIQEAYRQLKYASIKQNNRIREIEYEALEIEAFRKNKADYKSSRDKFILCTNRYSNFHGKDWLMPLIHLLWITLLLYILTNCTLGYTYSWGIPTTTEIAEYLEIALNPVHDIRKVLTESQSIKEKESIPGAVKVYDIISKLATGYFLFQFLRAFRKYVK